VSIVRQLAQAVLMLGLLGYTVRLMAAAIRDNHPQHQAATDHRRPTWVRDERGGGVLPGGDLGGDIQLDESFSVRFHYRDRPGALVTYCYYAATDLDDPASICVEQQTELLVCTDPADPGGTEVWSDYRYTTLARGFDSVEAATAAAKQAAEEHLVCNEPWSGRSPWEPE
jgi:hypothetical protein